MEGQGRRKKKKGEKNEGVVGLCDVGLGGGKWEDRGERKKGKKEKEM